MSAFSVATRGDALGGTRGTSSAVSFYGKKPVNMSEASLQGLGHPKGPDFEVHVRSLHHAASIVIGQRKREVFTLMAFFFLRAGVIHY